MGIYAKYILPKVTHFLCSQELITQQRKKLVPLARGRVLEIGIGSGLNLPFYDSRKVEHVWGVDPSKEMWNLANTRPIKFDVKYLQAPAENIPLADRIADTILVTYTLCTVPNIVDTLREMRRVLKPGGQLLFCEHGAAPDERVRRWQDRLNPIWKKVAGGCNINRPIPSILEKEGFRIRETDNEYIQGMKVASFNYCGIAV